CPTVTRPVSAIRTKTAPHRRRSWDRGRRACGLLLRPFGGCCPRACQGPAHEFADVVAQCHTTLLVLEHGVSAFVTREFKTVWRRTDLVDGVACSHDRRAEIEHPAADPHAQLAVAV